MPARYDESVRDAFRAWFAYSVGLTVPVLVPSARRQVLTPYTKHLVRAAEALSAADVVSAQSVLARYASTFLATLANFDIALTPTTSGPPMTVGYFTARGVEEVADLMLAWSCYTPWANLTGQPAMSVPSHLDAHGLPYGVQLVGRQRHDTQLFSVAAQLEGAGLWNDIHPPCWDH